MCEPTSTTLASVCETAVTEPDAGCKVGVLVTAANASATVSRMLRGWDRCVGLAIGPSRVHLLIEGGLASIGDPPAVGASPAFELDEGTLDRLMNGALTPLDAKLHGLIRTSGSPFDILRFAAILSASIRAARSARPVGGQP